MKDPVELLKEKSIIDFIDHHTNIQINKTGKNYSCPCPFHEEKESSFYINPEKNRWSCYGKCEANGDLIDFVVRYKNLPFNKTLEYLCGLYNIPFAKKQKKSISDSIKELNNFVADFYNKQITPNSQGYEYFVKIRNHKPELIKEFNIGYAPTPNEEGWQFLASELVKNKFSIELAEKVGVVKKGNRGNYIDCFFGRIIFPIYDLQDNCIGFNTRTIDSSVSPRYLLSKETEVFNRKNIHYGLNKTIKHIKNKDICVIVEGIFDFFRLYSNDIKNTIPLLGGFWGNSPVDVETFYLMMDFDKAGLKYSSSIGSSLISNNKVVRICSNKKDPDELIRKEIFTSIKEAKDFIDWWIDKNFKYKDSIEHKINILAKLSEILKNIKKDSIIMYSDFIAKKLEIPFNIVIVYMTNCNPNYKEILNEINNDSSN